MGLKERRSFSDNFFVYLVTMKSLGLYVLVASVVCAVSDAQSFDAVFARFHTGATCDSEVALAYDGIGPTCIPQDGDMFRGVGSMQVRCDGGNVKVNGYRSLNCSGSTMNDAEFTYPAGECVAVKDPSAADTSTTGTVGGSFGCSNSESYIDVCVFSTSPCNMNSDTRCVVGLRNQMCMTYGGESVLYKCEDAATSFQIYRGTNCDGEMRGDSTDIQKNTCTSVNIAGFDVFHTFDCVKGATQGDPDGGSGGNNTAVEVNGKCFSAESTIALEDGRVKLLKDVVVGDHVESYDVNGKQVFSEVFLIQHLDEMEEVSMLKLSWESTTEARKLHSVTLSPEHHIRAAVDADVYKHAGDIRIGDTIFLQGGHRAIVVHIEPTKSAPRNLHTLNDRLVIDGLLTSPYTTTFGVNTYQLRALLLPLKILHKIGFPHSIITRIDQTAHNIGRLFAVTRQSLSL